MRKIIMIAAGAMALAIPAAASASVTVNDAGVGFVGKGDVQSALGWNNGQVQNPANWNSLAFTYKQDVSQRATQNLTQSAKQAGKLSVSQDVTCTITTGGVNHQNVFHLAMASATVRVPASALAFGPAAVPASPTGLSLAPSPTTGVRVRSSRSPGSI